MNWLKELALMIGMSVVFMLGIFAVVGPAFGVAYLMDEYGVLCFIVAIPYYMALHALIKKTHTEFVEINKAENELF